MIDKITQTAWIERNVGNIVFNGTEIWNDFSYSTFNVFTFAISHVTSTPIRCSHYVDSSTNGVYWVNSSFLGFIFPKIYANVTSVKVD